MDEEDGDDVDEEVKASSSWEVEHSLEIKKICSLFSKNRGREMIDIIFNFGNLVILENYLQLMVSLVKVEKTFY